METDEARRSRKRSRRKRVEVRCLLDRKRRGNPVNRVKDFSFVFLLYSLIITILCPVLFFNGMFLMNDGVVFSRGVESSLLVKLYLLLMLPNVVILFVFHKRYIHSQFIG